MISGRSLWGFAAFGVLATAAARVTAEPSDVPLKPNQNHPPLFNMSLQINPAAQERFVESGRAYLRSGRTTRITLSASDTDDDVLRFSVDRLPRGATFDANLGVLVWTPTRADEGRYELVFEVTDGRNSAQRTFTLIVHPNRAPTRTQEGPISGIGRANLRTWHPGRRYLIPHYGMEGGGLVRSELGHRVQVRPYLGLHLFNTERLWLNASVGYRFVPANLADLSGPTFALGAVLHPW